MSGSGAVVAGTYLRPRSWKGPRLYFGMQSTGYSVLQDTVYPNMWRVRRPNGALSDFVNLTRAKDAALAMLDRDLRRGERRRATHLKPLLVTLAAVEAGDQAAVIGDDPDFERRMRVAEGIMREDRDLLRELVKR